jgi:hypothetical protein
MIFLCIWFKRISFIIGDLKTLQLEQHKSVAKTMVYFQDTCPRHVIQGLRVYKGDQESSGKTC